MIESERGSMQAVTVVIGAALLSAIGTLATWAIALVQVVDQGDSNAVLIGAIAAALSSTTGVIVWLVKRMFSGDMVHRDVARSEEMLARATVVLEAVDAREQKLLAHLVDES